MTDPKTGQSPLESFLYLFFRPSPSSQEAGRKFWARRHERKDDLDVSTSAQTMAAQRAAIGEWRQPRGERFAELKAIAHPTLVVNGHNDIMVPTINSYILSQTIPKAQLIIYPDSGHGSLFQFPELFVGALAILAGVGASGDGPGPIDQQHLAGDVSAGRGRQQDRCAHDFLRFGDAPRRRPGRCGFLALRI